MKKIFKGTTFFDEDAVFKKYLKHRMKPVHPNQLIEEPIILELLGPLESLDVLDMGCGYGGMADHCVRHSCASYMGFDASKKMIELAKHNFASDRIRFDVNTLEDWTADANRYDIVLSRMTLHYVEDLPAILCKVHRSLKSNGVMVFSVEHPLMTSSMGTYRPAGPKDHWRVEDYFVSGARAQDWMNGSVIKFHRTIEEHFEAFRSCGFTVEAIREGQPDRQYFADEAEFCRRRKLPRYLIMRCRKNSPALSN